MPVCSCIQDTSNTLNFIGCVQNKNIFRLRTNHHGIIFDLVIRRNSSLTLPGLAPTPGRISDPPGRRYPGGGSREGGRATSRKT
eukprot:1187818-Prorocentrum_minimum.AAC.2